MKRIALAIFGMSLFVASSAGAMPASPAGDWVTGGGQSIVRFSPCGSGWCGQIDRILRRDPGAADRDVNNPEPSLRSRTLQGMRIIELNRVAGDRWKGTIYDPRSGKTYSALVRRLAGNQLEVQGCLAIFCRTLRWATQ